MQCYQFIFTQYQIIYHAFLVSNFFIGRIREISLFYIHFTCSCVSPFESINRLLSLFDYSQNGQIWLLGDDFYPFTITKLTGIWINHFYNLIFKSYLVIAISLNFVTCRIWIFAFSHAIRFYLLAAQRQLSSLSSHCRVQV